MRTTGACSAYSAYRGRYGVVQGAMALCPACARTGALLPACTAHLPCSYSAGLELNLHGTLCGAVCAPALWRGVCAATCPSTYNERPTGGRSLYGSFVPYAGWLVRLCLHLWAQGHAHGFGRASAMALGRYPSCLPPV